MTDQPYTSDETTKYQEALHRNLVSHQGLMRAACVVLSVMIGVASFSGLRDIVGEGRGWQSTVIPFVAAAGGGHESR